MSQAMRWFNGKLVLSYIRNGDYAHPGEDEAINLSFSNINKDKNRLIMDVGCGLGGTANFIQQQGWGKVVGIDIESDSINYAQAKYPGIDFYVSDVLDVCKAINNVKFDLFCLFNSFFSFPDQVAALKSLRAIAKKEAKIIIFDYADLTADNQVPFEDVNEKNDVFLPIRYNAIKEILKQSNWNFLEIKDISYEYTQWYKSLLNRIEYMQKDIINKFGKTAYDNANNRYTLMYNSLLDKNFGGCVVYANACDSS